jgi:hypothetical protein
VNFSLSDQKSGYPVEEFLPGNNIAVITLSGVEGYLDPKNASTPLSMTTAK